MSDDKDYTRSRYRTVEIEIDLNFMLIKNHLATGCANGNAFSVGARAENWDITDLRMCTKKCL